MPAAVPIMIGLMATGTALQVVGQIKQGNAAKNAGEAAGKIEDFNALAAEQQAQDAEARGRDEEQRFRQTIRGTIGSQRAGFSGQNVDVGVGSAVDVQGDAAYLGELDARTIRANAAREALGYRTDVARAQLRGDYARVSGQNAQDASRYQAAGTILGGAAQTTGLLAQRYGWGGSKGSLPRTAGG